jgi:hypothetical protein
MRIELLPGLTNVIRFPVERRARPTLDLLREIAPDPREVGNVAEAFGLDNPARRLKVRRERYGLPSAARSGRHSTATPTSRSRSDWRVRLEGEALMPGPGLETV